MSQIKSRNWTTQEDQDLIAILDHKKQNHIQSTWNQIAIELKQKNLQTRKTGKQCRERWANQLDPKIKRSQIWTEEENEILFGLHFELGNKWAEICSRIPGRTDNCVKNHFYSTMRRGIRKINSYIENVKRKTSLSKTFKSQILNKVLTLCEGRNSQKLQFNDKAKSLAIRIKAHLIQLSLKLSDVDEENQSFKQQIFSEVSQFCRNCRKRKTKKPLDFLSEQQEEFEENLIKLCSPSQKLSLVDTIDNLKSGKKQEKPLQAPKHEILQHSTVVNEQNKMPLLNIAEPIFVTENRHNLKNEDSIKKSFHLLCRQNSKREGQEDPFSLACSWKNFSSLFCVYEQQKRIQQEAEKQEQGQASSIFKVEKIEKSQSKIANDSFDFMFFPTAQRESNLKETINTNFPSIIKSQELEIPIPIKMKLQNRKNSEEFGSFSFMSAFSPFSLCNPPLSFESFTNISTKSQKFTSTRYDSHDFEQVQNMGESNYHKQNQVTSTLLWKPDADQNIQE